MSRFPAAPPPGEKCPDREIAPTAVLRAEHDAITAVLSVVTRALDDGRLDDTEFWQDVLTFLRSFADRCHHAKEEDLLFPRLEAGGVPRAGGPIGVMLAEHEQGRALVRTMSALLPRLAAGADDASAAQQFVAAAREYCALLTVHIAKENGVLFPLAERLLSVDERREMLEAFARVPCPEEATSARVRLLADRLRRAL